MTRQNQLLTSNSIKKAMVESNAGIYAMKMYIGKIWKYYACRD
jgi:hypothetical protein